MSNGMIARRPALLDDACSAHDAPLPHDRPSPDGRGAQRTGDRRGTPAPDDAPSTVDAVSGCAPSGSAGRQLSRSPRPGSRRLGRRRPLTAGAPGPAPPSSRRRGPVRATGLPRHQRRRHRQAGPRRPRHLLHVLQLQGGDLRRGRRRAPGRLPARRRGRAAPAAGRPLSERIERANRGYLRGVRAERPDDGRARAGGDVQPAPGGDPPGQPPLLRPAQHDVDPPLAGAGPGRRAHRRRLRGERARAR